MRRSLLILLCLGWGLALNGQEKMYLHRWDNVSLGASIAETDSVYFSSDGKMMVVVVGYNTAEYPTSWIDSIYFGEDSDTVSIRYDGNSVSVINPFAFEGVGVTVKGANVTVTSINEIRDIHYKLSGTTLDGMFKIYSEKRFHLDLNGVSIVNPDGPAINIQSDKKVLVTLADGTVNTLADGSAYAAPPLNDKFEEEDQDAAFFSEGQLVFSGSGSLSISGTGTDKHALCSDDYVEVNGGNITVSSAARDGIHGKTGVTITGGTLNVNATGDAIDGDEGEIMISGGSVTTTTNMANANAITCDSTLVISGGNVNLTIGGDQSKGLLSLQPMMLSGGTININTSGAAVLEASGAGYNPAYCTGIKCSSNIDLSGADITIKSTGKAGKGISSGDGISITGGTVSITTSGAGATYKDSTGVTDAYFATCMTADGNISITGGTVIASSSGSAGKGITADGSITFGSTTTTPTVSVTTTGAKIQLSAGSGGGWGGFPGEGEYAEAKAIKSAGELVIHNGNLTISSNDDGIKSEASITINNGTVSITRSAEAMEAPYITVNNGNISMVASNDGFNATTGTGSEWDDGSCLYIYGGTIVSNVSNGDALDSNGDIVMTSGTVIAHGPQSQPEVGIDFNGTFNISGGLLVVSGTNSNMTEAPTATSAQYSVKVMSGKSLSGTTLFHVQDASGGDVLTFQPTRAYYSMIFSSSALTNGATYSIYTGGSSTGTNSNGLYRGGSYSGGTLKKTFTISGKVTNVSF